MLLLHNTGIEDAQRIAERIRERFENTVFTSADRQTVSTGVTQAKADDDIDSICIRVDTALYTAKSSGKNRVIVV